MRKMINIHWRDTIAILTVLLVMGSLVLIAYGVRHTNNLAEQQRRQINCIAGFFAETNRQSKTIECH